MYKDGVEQDPAAADILFSTFEPFETMLIIDPLDGNWDCGITTYADCNLYDPSLLHVVMTLDYGDGSGLITWTQDDPRQMYSHMYSMPGSYVISATVRNVKDNFLAAASVEVRVFSDGEASTTRELAAAFGAELKCPHTVLPGDYFYCTADIPRGFDLKVEVEMVDDVISGDPDIQSPIMEVPELIASIPGMHSPCTGCFTYWCTINIGY